LPVFVFLLMVGAAVLLQTTVLEYAAIMGIKPELVMLIAIFNGFLLGAREGAFLGFAGGVIEDLVSGSYIGLNALSCMVAGYLAGSGGERFFKENILVSTGIAFFSAAAGLTANYLLLMHAGIYLPALHAFLRVIFPSAAYTAVLLPLLFGRALRSFQIQGRNS